VTIVGILSLEKIIMNPEGKTYAKNRWYAVVVFFFFMLMHQADKLLIGPLTTPIQNTFGITNTQMGAVVTGALIVGDRLPIMGLAL
jgi:predicted MFS family arabinose efflux permease